MKPARALLVLLLLAGCREAAAPPQPAAAEETDAVDEERDNLLNAGYGAAVVSRTGELTLRDSALRAIDGDPDTAWSAPPQDPAQTLVFSLPAPVRIDALGLLTRPPAHTTALSFEVSTDGNTFEQVQDLKLPQSKEPQMFDVSVPRAQFLRVRVKDGASPHTTIRSLRLHGQWLAPRTMPSIEGCWTINGSAARFVERGGQIEGVLEDEGEPLYFSGGVHDATALVAWAKGPQWGEGLITLTPDGSRLSGMRFHEEPHWHSHGNAWFGERRPCEPAAVDARRVWQRFLAADGWYPLFGLHFDEAGALIEERSGGALDVIANVVGRLSSQPVRFVAREHREMTADANRARAAARLESLRTTLAKRGIDVSRAAFVAAGSESVRRPTPTAALRMLYSVVEIQIAEPDRSAF